MVSGHVFFGVESREGSLADRRPAYDEDLVSELWLDTQFRKPLLRVRAEPAPLLFIRPSTHRDASIWIRSRGYRGDLSTGSTTEAAHVSRTV